MERDPCELLDPRAFDADIEPVIVADFTEGHEYLSRYVVPKEIIIRKRL